MPITFTAIVFEMRYDDTNSAVTTISAVWLLTDCPPARRCALTRFFKGFPDTLSILLMICRDKDTLILQKMVNLAQ